MLGSIFIDFCNVWQHNAEPEAVDLLMEVHAILSLLSSHLMQSIYEINLYFSDLGI